MTTSIERFENELYLEHLEEAAALYEQRRAIMFDSTVIWSELSDYEGRGNAHVDALGIGGNRALSACLQAAMNTREGGDLYVVTALACRLKNKDALQECCSTIDPDEDAARAIADALLLDMPQSWTPELLPIAAKNPIWATAFIHYIGGRRLTSHGTWLQEARSEPAYRLALCQAYARLPHASAQDWLKGLLNEQADEEVCCWSAIALLIQGNHQLLAQLPASMDQIPWIWLPLALAGEITDSRHFQTYLQSDNSCLDEAFQAIGLLGDISSVPYLLECIRDQQLAPHAAKSLNLILGAELYEEVFVPAHPDPDELNEEELAMWKKGETPLEPDGSQPGALVTRLGQEPEPWSHWWQARSERFKPGRYRHGEPYSALTLLSGIKDMGTHNLVRQWDALELAIRHQQPWILDIFSPVARQRHQIKQYEQQLAPKIDT